jgi:CBS domain-containing protein
MNRSSPVSEIMHTDVLTFGPDDPVEDAMRALVDGGLDAAPVTDADGTVLGVLSSTDLIVQETQLHFPTLLSFLGASIEIGHKRFEEELSKALGSKVSDVMTPKPVTCLESDTVEMVATLMHDHDMAQIPVVLAGRLVGIVTRNDVLRAILSTD